MKLKSDITHNGVFWDVDEPSKTYTGVVKVSKTGAITVSLLEECDEFIIGESKQIKLLTGKVGGHPQLVTVQELIEISSFHNGSVISRDYSARYLYERIQYVKGETPEFNEIRFHVESAEQVFSNAGFNKTEGAVEFTTQENESYAIDSNYTVRIVHSVTSDRNAYDSTFTITHKTRFILSTPNKVSIHEILNKAHAVARFISFSSSSPKAITEIYLVDYDVKDRNAHAIIPFAFQSTIESWDNHKTHRYSNLINSKEVTDCLKKWFEVYDRFNEAINAYFYVLDRTYEFEENLFIMMVQILESYHTVKNRGSKPYSDEEFNQIRKEIAEKIENPEHAGFILTKINNLNAPSLLARLNEMFKQVEFYGVKIKEPQELAKYIRNTRNKLAHLIQDTGNNKVLTSEQMFKASMLLRGMFKVFVMKELGITDEFIISKIHQNQALKYSFLTEIL